MADLVSIITPCYNSELFIAKTINSVLAQTESNWEMLVVDDCSTDSSKSIVLSYAQKYPRIKLIELAKNTGAYHARNIAIQRAAGRYIAFLDSDDLWLPDKLQKQLQFMAGNRLAFSYTSYRLGDSENNPLGVLITKPSVTYEDLLKTCDIGCLTVMYDTQKLGKVYLPNITRGEDYALWLEILRKIKIAKGMVEPLAVYRIHDHSISKNKINSAICRWQIYREFEHLGRLKSFYYFCHYAYYGLTKYTRKATDIEKQ